MLNRLLEPKVGAAYALLRIVSGLLLAFHGIPKIFGSFHVIQEIFGALTDHPIPFGSQLWLGGLIELVCGIVIAAGLFTTWAAFLASGMMAVAYIQFHWRFGLGAQLLPIVNKGEPAVLNAFLFLYIACRGSGQWSIDALRGPTQKRR